MTPDPLSRRNVLRLTGATLAAVSSGGTALAQLSGAADYDDIAWLIGTEAERPPASTFDYYEEGHWVYWAIDDGAHYELDDSAAGWSELATHLPGYAVGDLPTDVDSGTLVFDTNRGLPSWWDRDHYERPNFVDNRDVMVTPVTVADTTAETQVFSIGFNEDSMVQGRVYQLDLHGTFGTTNNSDMFTIGIELGGVEIATLSNEPANATGVPWSMETTFTVRSHGQNGEVQPHSRGVFNSITKDDHHPTATVDTTVTEMLSVTVAWSAADPANTVTLGQAHLKQMA